MSTLIKHSPLPWDVVENENPHAGPNRETLYDIHAGDYIVAEFLSKADAEFIVRAVTAYVHGLVGQ